MNLTEKYKNKVLAVKKPKRPPNGNLAVISDLFRYPDAESYLQSIRLERARRLL